MKRFITILSAVMVTCITGILWYRWDSEMNHGCTWGYWGQFNIVSNSLAKLPGVTIVSCWCNADITLEEFGFEVVGPEKQHREIGFREDDPIRRLAGDALSKALLEKINHPASRSQPPSAVTGS